ncbi:MAG TPA: amidohydrolase [Vicinamibacteria bacterium]|nr:amidohydrolase [Vicinamibacteria bacterium]
MRKLCWSVMAVLLPLTASAGEGSADLVLSGGNLVTLDPARPRATAVAVRGGRIVAVGGEAEVRPFVGPATRRIDLKGRTVLPGLTDAHVHVMGLGQARESLSLVGAQSLDQALRRVAEKAKGLPPGEWVLGRGWDQNDWPEKRFPTAAELDRVSGDRPVFLVRVDGHAGWANSKALALAGVDRGTPDPPGGRIIRGPDNAPAGVLVDAAQGLVAAKIPAASRDTRKRHLALGLKAAAEAGLTSVHDAGVDLDDVALYKELLAEQALPIRVYVMLRGPREFLARGGALKPEVGLGDGRLSIRAIKAVADGALGSRGALLLAPYSDEPGVSGLLTFDQADFGRLLERAAVQGFQVATHAIGDAANRLVLDAYQKALAGNGAAHRFRVEHAQILALADVPRFKALGVIPSMQPTHCTSDMYWAEDRVGAERGKGAYLWKTFLKQGVPVAGGSDAPVESIAVLPGIHAAITRQDAKGWPPEGWHPEESVTPLEAVQVFARDAAFAAFEEADRGSIAPGKRADFTVLTRDVTTIAPAEVLKTEISLTMVGGEVVYQAPGR